MDRLFARFSAIWGHRWTGPLQHPAALRIARAEWAESLAGLSQAEIDAGVRKAKQDLEWPPSVAEFLTLCRDRRENAAMYRAFPPALPKPRTPAGQARAHLGEMLAKLRGGRP